MVPVSDRQPTAFAPAHHEVLSPAIVGAAKTSESVEKVGEMNL